MENLLRAGKEEGGSLPARLVQPVEIARKFAQAETRDFTALATRKAEQPIYRGKFVKPEHKFWNRRYWRTMMAAIAPRFEKLFQAVEEKAAGAKKLTALLARLDQQASDQERWNLSQDNKLKAATRAEIEQHSSRMTTRELKANPEVTELLDELLRPILDAVAGDGKSLLTSIVPPAILEFLLELDSQHTNNWAARSKRLLEFQILYFEIKHAEKACLEDKGDKLDVVSIDAQFERNSRLKDMWKRWAENKVARCQEKQEGLLELQALDELTAEPRVASAEDLSRWKNELANFDSLFRNTRREALVSFLGTRMIAALFKTRHDDPDRVLSLLEGRLANLVYQSPLIDQILNCSKQEREAVAKAAVLDMISLQAAWKELRADSGSKMPSGKSASSPDKPRSKRLSQPNEFRTEDRAKRRQATLDRFLDDYEVAALRKNLADNPAELKLLDELGAQLQLLVKFGERVSRETMLEASIKVLEDLYRNTPEGPVLPSLDMITLKSRLQADLQEQKKLKSNSSAELEPAKGSSKRN